jgi:hypothetical protein
MGGDTAGLGPIPRIAAMHPTLSLEIAAAAARLVVDEGMDYGPAKRRAAQALGRQASRVELPDNDQLEDAVREHIALFCADTQPGELAVLREIAATWMARLAEFRPHLCGAVWRGTATRLSRVHLELYCDDGKAAEIALLNAGVAYEVGSTGGPRGRDVDVLVIDHPCRDWGDCVPVHLSVLDHDDLRGALKPDARGHSARGDLAALRRRIAETAATAAEAGPPP